MGKYINIIQNFNCIIPYVVFQNKNTAFGKKKKTWWRHNQSFISVYLTNFRRRQVFIQRSAFWDIFKCSIFVSHLNSCFLLELKQCKKLQIRTLQVKPNVSSVEAAVVSGSETWREESAQLLFKFVFRDTVYSFIVSLLIIILLYHLLCTDGIILYYFTQFTFKSLIFICVN